MRILFLGSGAFGLPTLEALAFSHEIVGVISQPDRPAGRGGKLTPTPIADWVISNRPEIPLLRPEDVNEPSVCRRIRDLAGPRAAPTVHAWVVIAYGQKLSTELLDGVFACNLHASLLPRWRGAAPINAAILAGDAETGNSVITIAQRIDAGHILGQSRRPIMAHHTAGDLHDLLAADGPRLITDVLRRLEVEKLTPVEQDEALATRAPKLSKADGWVDFARPADECRRRIHGLTPWPGVAVSVDGRSLKLLRVQAIDTDHQREPGRLVDEKAGLVACGERSALKLIEVHPAGRRAMHWEEFARGGVIGAGARFDSGMRGGAPGSTEGTSCSRSGT